jgi:hypothetical protein
MAFCRSDLWNWRACDAYSIDILIQHGKLSRDRECGKAASTGFSLKAEIRKSTPLWTLSFALRFPESSHPRMLLSLGRVDTRLQP